MCGIWGQATNNPKKINQGNIRILGMFNESRGKNSCGITIDGEIFHGLDKEKLFTDFMKGRDLSAKQYPLIFGHTRQSSVGLINEHNAHPFGFYENKQGNLKFIGVHNGTLHNYKELAKDYGVDTSAKYHNEHGTELTRQKIDSEILLEILSIADNDYSVLSHYNGRAALVWTDTDNPNVVYLFSGESKISNYINSKVEEERPMNIYIESKNNMYFSSLPESLFAIGGNDENVFQIDYNTVYSIKNGDFANARKTVISRDEMCINEIYSSYGGTTAGKRISTNTTAGTGAINHSYNHRRVFKDTNDYLTNAYHSDRKVPFRAIQNNAFNFPDEDKVFNQEQFNAIKNRKVDIKSIYDDKPLNNPDLKSNIVYPKKLRFWCKEKLITGVYIYIEGHGFFYLDTDIRDAYDKWVRTVGVRFVDGNFDYNALKTNEGRVIYSDPDKCPSFYYFYEGCRLKMPIDYTTLMDIKERTSGGGSKNVPSEDYIKLSHCVDHAILDIAYTTKGVNQAVYKDGVLFSGIEKGFGFDKKYCFKDGNLTSVYSKLEITKSSDVIILPATLEKEKISKEITLFDGEGKIIESLKEKLIEHEIKQSEILALERKKSKEDKEFEESLEDTLEDEMNQQEKDFEGMSTYRTLNEKGEIITLVLTEEDANKEVQIILNDHFIEPMDLFQKCKVKLRPFLNLASGREGTRLIDNINAILMDYVNKTDETK